MRESEEDKQIRLSIIKEKLCNPAISKEENHRLQKMKQSLEHPHFLFRRTKANIIISLACIALICVVGGWALTPQSQVTSSNLIVLNGSNTLQSYDGSINIGLGNLGGVAFIGLINNQVLGWNATTSTWQNMNQTGTVSNSYSMENLTDANFMGLTNGDIATWNSTSSKWYNAQPFSGSWNTTVNQLITSATITTGQVTGLATYINGLISSTSITTGQVTGLSSYIGTYISSNPIAYSSLTGTPTIPTGIQAWNYLIQSFTNATNTYYEAINGSTDNVVNGWTSTNAAQTVNYALSATVNGLVYCTGNYVINSTFLIPSGDTLGFSLTSMIYLSSGSDCSMVKNADYLTTGDTNIAVYGGIWNDNGYNQVRNTTTPAQLNQYIGNAFFFNNVNGLDVYNLQIWNCDSYGIRPQDVSNVHISNIIFYDQFYSTGIYPFTSSEDGIHVFGPAYNIHISDISGQTGDDMIALDTGQNTYWQLGAPYGSISGVTITDITSTSTGNGRMINFYTLSAPPYTISQVSVNGLSGNCSFGAVSFENRQALNTFFGISITNVNMQVGSPVKGSYDFAMTLSGDGIVVTNVNLYCTQTCGSILIDTATNMSLSNIYITGVGLSTNGYYFYTGSSSPSICYGSVMSAYIASPGVSFNNVNIVSSTGINYPFNTVLGPFTAPIIISNEYFLNYSGNVDAGPAINATVSQTVASGQLIFVNSTGFFLTSATSNLYMPVIGITWTAANSGQICTIGTFGGLEYSSAWSWTPGSYIYAGTTAGTLTSTYPSGTGNIDQVIGVALSANIIEFYNPTSIQHT